MESTIGRRNNTYRESTSGPEVDVTNMHPLISWRSVVAGLLIAFFSMVGLVGLGLAFGGIGMDEDTTIRGASIFTGVWFLISSLISIFLGSYFAARVSKFQTGRIGSAQGLVIAALFLGFFLLQTIGAIGTAGNVVGGGAGLVTRGVQQVAQSPAITDTVSSITEDALGDLTLKSDPQTVATGLGSRLVRGETESAKNYLANQAGIPPAEADARINELQAQVSSFIDNAKNTAAAALRNAGWSLFLLTLLGALAAIGGGALGSVTNFRKPLSREFALKHQHA